MSGHSEEWEIFEKLKKEGYTCEIITPKNIRKLDFVEEELFLEEDDDEES